ncbi:VPLPA-CTERM sorting domain-containing protein [Dinoroseobacter sp. S76]|uniref:VPLPA-CTERM sorting domain-containing protein n=1 Tax=Dinoroseobacter sp. S76 TaxID=3415124 RepID=UPI003C7B4864
MLKPLLTASALTLALGASAASAGSLDFTTLGSGTVNGSTALLPEATLTSGADAFFVGANSTNSICALSTSAFNCANDLTVEFSSAVANLSFNVEGWQSGDRIDVTLFDAMSNALETTTILANGVVSFSSTGVTSIFLDDSSTAFGVSYADWTFDDATSPIPLPAGLPLLLTTLGGLGLVARRRKSS